MKIRKRKDAVKRQQRENIYIKNKSTKPQKHWMTSSSAVTTQSLFFFWSFQQAEEKQEGSGPLSLSKTKKFSVNK